MTPGQHAYERDVARRPTYDDGAPRKRWEELPDYAQYSWEHNPTERVQTSRDQAPNASNEDGKEG
jgi:hypothetical protein